MPWHAIDLDETLAKGPVLDLNKIGPPVPSMLDKVKTWLDKGEEVRIFTARASSPECIPLIEEWCKTHIGRILPITNVKDYGMIDLYDDRAVQVEKNTGRILGPGPQW